MGWDGVQGSPGLDRMMGWGLRHPGNGGNVDCFMWMKMYVDQPRSIWMEAGRGGYEAKICAILLLHTPHVGY